MSTRHLHRSCAPFLWSQTDLTKNHSGWCINNLTDVCCDATTEETCIEIDSITGEYKNSCKAIADGGCPCWEGTERCGAGEVDDVKIYLKLQVFSYIASLLCHVTAPIRVFRR